MFCEIHSAKLLKAGASALCGPERFSDVKLAHHRCRDESDRAAYARGEAARSEQVNLAEEQLSVNRNKSKVRAKVERTFGVIKRGARFTLVRSISAFSRMSVR